MPNLGPVRWTPFPAASVFCYLRSIQKPSEEPARVENGHDEKWDEWGDQQGRSQEGGPGSDTNENVCNVKTPQSQHAYDCEKPGGQHIKVNPQVRWKNEWAFRQATEDALCAEAKPIESTDPHKGCQRRSKNYRRRQAFENGTFRVCKVIAHWSGAGGFIARARGVRVPFFMSRERYRCISRLLGKPQVVVMPFGTVPLDYSCDAKTRQESFRPCLSAIQTCPVWPHHRATHAGNAVLARSII